MTTFDATFERKETKYRLSADQYMAIRALLIPLIEPDRYGASTMVSTYWDTPERYLIERSLEKPLYKEKLRVRHYGEAIADEDEVYVELKKKYKGIVYKRRVRMSARAARAFMRGMPYERAVMTWPLADAGAQQDSLDAKSRQIAREIFAMQRRYGRLAPSMDIRTSRTAYKLTDEGQRQTPFGLRITFDEHIAARDLFRDNAAWVDVIPSGATIMEVKCSGAYPLWLVDALDSLEIYPCSFSKYGVAYQQLLKGEVTCSIA